MGVQQHMHQSKEPVEAAFITNKGLFEQRVMFFGLTNSSATFQMMINTIFAEELRQDWLTIYMDNILVHTLKDKELHRWRVHKILQKLAEHNLFLKPEKCQFEQKSIEFLGVILSKGTVQMDNHGPSQTKRNHRLASSKMCQGHMSPS
jgi:hypothetical protein